MKILAIALAFTFAFFTKAEAPAYTFQLRSITGKDFNLAQYKGKKILVVNTASKCGFTPQYKELEKLYETYKDKLVIVGFPANNFGGQEPGTDSEIQTFCHDNFSVSFPMSTKVSVKGDDICPLFKYLTTAQNPDFTGDIHWNFEKFLLDENGNLIHRFRSQTTPMSPDLTKYL